MGVLKQGEFDKIGQSDEEAAQVRAMQGIHADGSRVKFVNQQVCPRHAYAYASAAHAQYLYTVAACISHCICALFSTECAV